MSDDTLVFEIECDTDDDYGEGPWMASIAGPIHRSTPSGFGATAWDALAHGIRRHVATTLIRNATPTACPWCGSRTLRSKRDLAGEWSEWSAECALCRRLIRVGIDTEELWDACDALIAASDGNEMRGDGDDK